MKKDYEETSFEVGGNRVSIFKLGSTQRKTSFSVDPYQYFLVSLKKNESIIIDDLSSFSVVLPDQSGDVAIRVNESLILQPKMSLQVENSIAKLTAVNDDCKILVSGVQKKHQNASSIIIKERDEIKRVVKPWGYELWISGEHPSYVFKEIFIKKGTRTSLQYHEYKSETNLLYQGEANLHYKKKNLGEKRFENNDIEALHLKAMASIDVEPLTIHRLEAVTDILLFEVSTPQIDDVIRIQDDMNRSDGRILQEHGNV